MDFELNKLVRPNIRALEPYSCARDEFKGMEAHVFLDANENPYNNPVNRYPDPLQEKLKGRLAPLKQVRPSQIFLGNGSDEAIDLVYRIFCTPGRDNVVAIAPTYGMYKVCADINDVEYRAVPLSPDWQLDAQALLRVADAQTKVIWICSPNNPTGNEFPREVIHEVLTCFGGIVVIDEAYSDFSSQVPFRTMLDRYPNLIVLNTFSKAWASAAIRLGMAFASEDIIALFNKVKYPYNVNLLTQEKACALIDDLATVDSWLAQIRRERDHVLPALSELPIVREVFPSDANFVLVRVTDANRIYRYLVEKGIVVRNRHRVQLCNDCLRITIGTRQENNELLGALRFYK
ncbi:MAG: histidinol-phosphate transaminase [Bacteroidaceae bacterium]|nr:histidinol-phosphate transaminase [Bacteroidaceae bacterium]